MSRFAPTVPLLCGPQVGPPSPAAWASRARRSRVYRSRRVTRRRRAQGFGIRSSVRLTSDPPAERLALTSSSTPSPASSTSEVASSKREGGSTVLPTRASSSGSNPCGGSGNRPALAPPLRPALFLRVPARARGDRLLAVLPLPPALRGVFPPGRRTRPPGPCRYAYHRCPWRPLAPIPSGRYAGRVGGAAGPRGRSRFRGSTAAARRKSCCARSSPRGRRRCASRARLAAARAAAILQSPSLSRCEALA